MAKVDGAKQRYLMRIKSIKHSLDRLQEACEQQFGVTAENANWGDVGDAYDIDMKLKHLCDRIFKEGEYISN